MRTNLRRVALTVALVLSAAPRSMAQSDPNVNHWTRATAIGVFAGASTSAGAMRPAVGGTATWEVSRWAAIESRGDWFDRTAGSQAFGATISAIVNLVPRQTTTPFAAIGFGLHHTSFDTAVATMPEFYGRRARDSDSSPVHRLRSFTDPAFSFGTGIDLLVSRHVAVRPEIGMLLIRGAGQTQTIGTVGVRMAYRFEAHPVTP